MTRTQDLEAKIDALGAQITELTAAQARRDEFFDELTPILRDAMGVWTTQLGSLEERGYFDFGKALLEVADRVVTGFGPDDVHEFAEAIVSILDAVRALTQPQMLQVMNDLSDATQEAGEMQPVGVFGMLRASQDVDAGRGMAVMVEVLRRLGHGAKKLDRADRLRAQLAARKADGGGPRRTGAERPARTGAGRPARAAAEQTPARRTRQVGPAPAWDPPAPAPATPPVQTAPVMVDGVAFTPEGFLVDASQWNRELAEALAASIGVRLTEQHWKLLEYARGEYEKSGASPNIRKLTQGSGIPTKELYAMFPKAPGKCTAMIAGLPKPVGCI